jgi:DNA-binding FrmR family transcriptional regulator
MKALPPAHRDDIVRLKRIEGQVRGVQKMIEEGRYCIDILTVLASVTAALERVEDRILGRHLRTCVQQSFSHGSSADKDKKIGEIVDLLKKFRRN